MLSILPINSSLLRDPSTISSSSFELRNDQEQKAKNEGECYKSDQTGSRESFECPQQKTPEKKKTIW